MTEERRARVARDISHLETRIIGRNEEQEPYRSTVRE